MFLLSFDFQTQVNNFLFTFIFSQTFDYYLPEEIKWRGCQGSKPHYRGFPCSLWVLFHSMTVHCATSPETGLTGLEVLQRIRGFIDVFFGCRYCRDHFVEMAKNLTNEVKTHEDAILWLWSRHNRVNARLAQDVSTDPWYPKVQFPPPDLCIDCRKETDAANTIVTSPGYGVPETKWNKKVVLEFLKEHYGPDNIRVKDTSPFQDNEADGHETVRKRAKYFHVHDITGLGLGMNSIDASLCVVLYIIAIGSVIGIYLYLTRRRRKQWKHIV